MAKILKLHQQKPLRLGHKKVNKNKLSKLEDKGQLNLFKKKVPKILSIEEDLSPFEFAFKRDENNDKGAKEAYLQAIAKKDRAADAYCNLGIIEAKSGHDIKAIDYFSQSLALAARHFEAHFNMANIYFDNENYPLAKLHYKTALELEPDDPNVYYNLGLVYALQEEVTAAIEVLSTYVTMVKEHDAAKANELISNLKLSSER